MSEAPSVRRACVKARAFAMRETEAGLERLSQLRPSRERELLALLVRGLIERRA